MSRLKTQNRAHTHFPFYYWAKRMIQTALAVSVLSPPVWAAGKATVEVSAKRLADKKVELTFAAKPAAGLVINSEGPWKLTVVDPGSIKLDRSEYKREDWSEKNAGFSVIAAPGAKNTADLKYKMVVFVCTKEKTQCFREVIESPATVSWK